MVVWVGDAIPVNFYSRPTLQYTIAMWQTPRSIPRFIYSGLSDRWLIVRMSFSLTSTETIQFAIWASEFGSCQRNTIIINIVNKQQTKTITSKTSERVRAIITKHFLVTCVCVVSAAAESRKNRGRTSKTYKMWSLCLVKNDNGTIDQMNKDKFTVEYNTILYLSSRCVFRRFGENVFHSFAFISAVQPSVRVELAEREMNKHGCYVQIVLVYCDGGGERAKGNHQQKRLRTKYIVPVNDWIEANHTIMVYHLTNTKRWRNISTCHAHARCTMTTTEPDNDTPSFRIATVTIKGQQPVYQIQFSNEKESVMQMTR